MFALKSPLSTVERSERRRLIISDTVALVTLSAITALLAVLTNFLYQSYASHQAVLARRWIARGDQALHDNKPQAAIDALSSALAYAPSDRNTEIKLAEALASAGRIQEASVYFNTLLESQQGNGLINLQLARLAARQGNQSEAIEDYQRAIYGNWEGDGYLRRRDVRIELTNYLISHGLLDQARSELLVAEGNAPEDDISVHLQIAQTMERAQDPGDALHLYRTLLRHHGTLREALLGAGRTAFEIGRYAEAKRYLSRALEGSTADQDLAADLEQSRQLLAQANRLLLLYPSPRLSPKEQTTRILADRKIALDRLAQCTQSSGATPPAAPPAKGATPAPALPGGSLAAPLKNFASRFSRHPATPATGATVAPSPTDLLQSLTDRWQDLPARMTQAALINDPELTQTQLQLIYDTETTTRQVCGPPSGDNDLLLKIAQAPNQVEEE